MAGGNITRIIGGKNSIETEEWIVYTDKFTAYAGKGSHFTADAGTVFGNPKEVDAGDYFKKGWWSSDEEGNEKITKAKIGDIVYFQVEMTKKFPESSLKEKQKTISFKMYEFDGYDYSLGLIYLFGPRLTVKRKPTKDEKQKISYVSWEDINKNNKLDPAEEYSKKPYTEVEAEGNKAVISFQLSEGLRKIFPDLAAIKLFLSLSYNTDIEFDLPENESGYLDVELYCCSEACRKPWQDLVDFDPRTVPAVSNYIQNKYDHSIFQGQKVHWAILPIDEAYGDKLNMDYYSVKIKKMPSIRPIDYKKPWNLQEKKMWSSDVLFEHIRKNLGYFLNQDIANLYADSARDQNVWDSTNPITAVMVFDVSVYRKKLPIIGETTMIFDDAAVMCTSFIPNQSWIFSPIQNPINQQHPVSGNRQFGIKKNGNEYEFYVRGADRLTGFLDSLGETAAFAGADGLWKSFQLKLINFINLNGGYAEIDEIKYVWKRCKWIAK